MKYLPLSAGGEGRRRRCGCGTEGGPPPASGGRSWRPWDSGNEPGRASTQRMAIRAIDANPGPSPDRLGQRANVSESER